MSVSVRNRLIAVGLLVAGVLSSCDQHPYPLAPDVTDYSWRTLHEAESNGNSLSAIWSSGPDDIWTGGIGGQVFRYDGTGWSELSLPTGPPPASSVVQDIQDDGAGTVYVGASHGVYRHAAGVVERIGDGVSAIWVLGPDDVLATSDHSLLHYNGTTWTTLVSGLPMSPIDLWAASASDAYVLANVELYHYDGATITLAHSTGDDFFESLWGSGPDDVYVSGSIGVHHYDGTSWEQLYFSVHHTVWGTGPDDVYILGGHHIDYYDGVEWQRLDPPLQLFLRGGYGSLDTEVLACGAAGSVLRIDNDTWDVIRGVEPALVGSAWPLGDDELVVTYPWTLSISRVAHYRDGAWHELPSLPYHLSYLWGYALDNLYVMDDRSAIYHFDGEEWGYVGWPLGTVEDIWYTGPTSGVACGTDVYRFDGDQWDHFFGTWDKELLAVSSDTSGTIVAVGEAGTVARYDGVMWHEERIDGGIRLGDVWVGAPDLAVAVGEREESGETFIYHFDGERWRVEPEHRGWSAKCVVGRARDDAFVTGINSLYHFDGSYWRQSPSGPHVSDLIYVNDRIIGWNPLEIVEIDGR